MTLNKNLQDAIVKIIDDELAGDEFDVYHVRDMIHRMCLDLFVQSGYKNIGLLLEDIEKFIRDKKFIGKLKNAEKFEQAHFKKQQVIISSKLRVQFNSRADFKRKGEKYERTKIFLEFGNNGHDGFRR